MATKKQYPPASSLTVPKRLNLVVRLVEFGMGPRQIADELQYTLAEAKRDVASVKHLVKDIDDIEAYMKDVTGRTAQLLEGLNRQEAILWKQLDYANEWVVQTDAFGAAKHELGPDGKKGAILYGPRNASAVRSLISQIQSVNKQQAEILGILNKNVDITVKLEQAEKIQILIIENLREADPGLYGRIRRELIALKASQKRPDMPQAGIGRNIEDVIEGEYRLHG